MFQLHTSENTFPHNPFGKSCWREHFRNWVTSEIQSWPCPVRQAKLKMTTQKEDKHRSGEADCSSSISRTEKAFLAPFLEGFYSRAARCEVFLGKLSIFFRFIKLKVEDTGFWEEPSGHFHFPQLKGEREMQVQRHFERGELASTLFLSFNTFTLLHFYTFTFPS